LDKPVRVLLLEDSPADGELIDLELQRGTTRFLLHRVSSAQLFVQALDEFAPDAVISNHSHDHFNALAALREVHARRPAAPLIVVSAVSDEQVMVRCLRAGAEDFIAKHRLNRLPAAVVAALDVRASLRELTPRQMQVFRLIACGHTTREIADVLRISAKTVETHRIAVMKKINVHEVAGLVRYAMRVGLGPPES
jgi:DNA-binding NarL/FixJ family response regulator